MIPNRPILISYASEQVEKNHIFSHNVDLRETKTAKRISILIVFFSFLFVCLFCFGFKNPETEPRIPGGRKVLN